MIHSMSDLDIAIHNREMSWPPHREKSADGCHRIATTNGLPSKVHDVRTLQGDCSLRFVDYDPYDDCYSRGSSAGLSCGLDADEGVGGHGVRLKEGVLGWSPSPASAALRYPIMGTSRTMSVYGTLGVSLPPSPFFRRTRPYCSIVFRVRDRFDFARPESSASSVIDPGRASAISSRRARFRSERTRAKLSMEVNHTFGSPRLGCRSPRAIAVVRSFIAS